MTGYKSVEQRIFDEELKEFLGTSIKYCYGTIASLFRIPTTIRKIRNKQIIALREDISKNIGGYIIGCLSGLGAEILIADYITKEATRGNYTPLAVWGATNVASGLFELGRLKTSREEYTELKQAEKAAVEKQS